MRTPMAVAAMQGADQRIRGSLRFSILPKDTWIELNQQPDNKMPALPLSRSRSCTCYLYILNAPGSSARQSMSLNSRASLARSSSSCSSSCCCHGSMVSQILGAVVSPPPKNDVNDLWCCAFYSCFDDGSGKLFLTVVLLEHFCKEQVGHHIVLHLHQQEDVWQGDTAPGLTSNLWDSGLPWRGQ